MGNESTGYCIICKKGSTEVLHEHHVIPQAYGGRDKGTVTLCAEHHNMIHMAATKILTAIRGGRTQDFKWPKGHGDEQIAQQLVFKIVEAALTSKVKNYKLVLEFDQIQREQLEILKHEMGVSSLEKTVYSCLDLVFKSRIR